MAEPQVVLPDRVPLNQVEDKPTPEVETPLIDTELSRKGDINFMDNIEYHRVADSLDISYEDRKVTTLATKISFLYDWAKEVTKSDDRMTRVEAIVGLQRQLGIQGKGPETIKKLYQYARLDQDRRRIEREMNIIGQ